MFVLPLDTATTCRELKLQFLLTVAVSMETILQNCLKAPEGLISGKFDKGMLMELFLELTREHQE